MSDPTAKSNRPLWYNISPLNLPVPGLVSFFHRISGLALFLGMFWLLYLLEASLASAESFAKFMALVAHPLAKLVLLGFMWAFLPEAS